MKLSYFLGKISTLGLLVACSHQDPRLPELLAGKLAEERELVARGAEVYRGSCVSCHAYDPREEGPVGPAIAGSPLELLESRVLEASYPTGYVPKRRTAEMMKMPQLKSQIPALYNYLKAYKDLP